MDWLDLILAQGPLYLSLNVLIVALKVALGKVTGGDFCTSAI